MKTLPVQLSALDTQRWKVATARAPIVSSNNLAAVLAFCREHGVRFLIARCATDDLPTARAMEEAGFHIMDTLVYFARDLADPIPDDTGLVLVREARAEDAPAVSQVAADAFSGYRGHYHADPHLERDECDAAYVDWARRSCLSKDVADAVLVGVLEGKIAGFITIRLTSDKQGEVPLYGVTPHFQRRSIGRVLLISALRWCRARGRANMTISTQITNLRSLKLWARLGFELSDSYYTFHKWFSGT